MSSRKRRGSKWDLTRDITPEKFHNNGRSIKAGSSFHEHESREYLSGRRGYHRNEHVSEETLPAWDGVGRHDTARMSPGLDGWRRRTRSRSPRSSRGRSLRSKSRSRSHSPAHNPRREPVFNDRNNGWESRQTGPLRHASFDYHSNDRRSAPICNNFLAGRCRKGSLCKYAHHDAGSSEFGKELMDEVHKDGYGDWRGKGGRSYDSDREPHKGIETLCRYFVAGNCRNGKHCKFSHNQEELHRHERRSLGERRIDNGRNDMDDVWNTSLKWTNNTDPPSSGDREAYLREEDRCKAMDSAKLREMDQSNYDYVDQVLTDQNHPRHVGAFACGDNKMALGSEDQSHQWKGDVGSESKRGGSLYNEKAMSSPNGRFKPQIGIAAQNSDSLSYPQISIPSGELDIARGALSDNNHISRFPQPSVSNGYTQINPSFGNVTGVGIENNARPLASTHVSSNILPGLSIHRTDENGQSISGLSASALSQTYHIYPNVGEGVQMSQSHDAKPKDVVYVGNASLLQTNTGTASLGGTNALSEQLAQFSQLSTTLAHLLEKRQHLIPQQSGTNDCTSNLPRNTAVPLVPPPASAANLPSQGGGPMRLYDPVCDSLESKPSQSVEQTNSRLGPLGTAEIPSSTSMLPLFAPGVPIAACSDNGLGEKIKDQKIKDPSEEVNVTVPEGQNIGVEGRNEEQDNGPHDDADIEDGDGDGEKKPKDSKVMRAFKFALAEFVKELLKPTWKDGQVSKEVYKTIVKKVVDKVTDTLQADNVPRTKEKINHYLSFSKPKLSKLVQAYLEKYQKA